MIERITAYVKLALAVIEDHAFCTGFCAGLLAFLIVLLFLFHLRAKRVSSLSFRTDSGTVSVSADAVAGVVESLSGQFPEFKFRKIRLMRKHGRIYLDIAADDLGRRDSALPAASDRLQKLALQTIRAHFGLDDIYAVSLHFRSSRPPERFSQPSESAKPAPDPEKSV